MELADSTTATTYNNTTNMYSAVLAVHDADEQLHVLIDDTTFLIENCLAYPAFTDIARVVPEGTASSTFGAALDFSDEWLVVGDSARDAVLIYRREAEWALAAALASPFDSGGEFGAAVAVSAGWIAAAAPKDSGAAEEAGAVALYALAAGAWVLNATLRVSDAAYRDQFGVALALDGDALVVGAHFREVNSEYYAGAAFAYALRGGAWASAATLLSDDPSFNENFAKRVSLSGDVAAIGGARFKAYIFEQDAEGWALAKVLMTNSQQVSVHAAGAYVFVGRYKVSTIDVYARADSAWYLESTVSGASGETFGYAMAYAQDTLAVGAIAACDGATYGGAVSVFYREPGASAWTLNRTAYSDTYNGQLGRAVATDGFTVCAGGLATGEVFTMANAQEPAASIEAHVTGPDTVLFGLVTADMVLAETEFNVTATFDEETYVAPAWSALTSDYTAELTIPATPDSIPFIVRFTDLHSGQFFIDAFALQTAASVAVDATVEPGTALAGELTDFYFYLFDENGSMIFYALTVLAGWCGGAATETVYNADAYQYRLTTTGHLGGGERSLCLYNPGELTPFEELTIDVQFGTAAALDGLATDPAAPTTDGFAVSFALVNSAGATILEDRTVSAYLSDGDVALGLACAFDAATGVYSADVNPTFPANASVIVQEPGEAALAPGWVRYTNGAPVTAELLAQENFAANQTGVVIYAVIYDADENVVETPAAVAVTFGGTAGSAFVFDGGICSAVFDIPADVTNDAFIIAFDDASELTLALGIPFGAAASVAATLEAITKTSASLTAALTNAYGVAITDGRTLSVSLDAEHFEAVAYNATTGAYAGDVTVPSHYTGALIFSVGGATISIEVDYRPVLLSRTGIILLAVGCGVVLAAAVATAVVYLCVVRPRRARKAAAAGDESLSEFQARVRRDGEPDVFADTDFTVERSSLVPTPTPGADASESHPFSWDTYSAQGSASLVAPAADPFLDLRARAEADDFGPDGASG